MSGGSPTNGVADSYDDMTPIPVISYNQTNNTLVIHNPAQTPQVAPHPSQTNFNTVKAHGLSHYDNGISNAPTSSLNFRSIEMGWEGRYPQIAMPWDADQMFFWKAAK